jgi:GDP-mannose transporter
MNKCLTILLNVMIWDQHAPPGGIFCLFVCIGGGMVYKQSPMRNERKVVSTGITADDDEFKADINPHVYSKDVEDMEMEPLVGDDDGPASRRR